MYFQIVWKPCCSLPAVILKAWIVTRAVNDCVQRGEKLREIAVFITAALLGLHCACLCFVSVLFVGRGFVFIFVRVFYPIQWRIVRYRTQFLGNRYSLVDEPMKPVQHRKIRNGQFYVQAAQGAGLLTEQPHSNGGILISASLCNRSFQAKNLP